MFAEEKFADFEGASEAPVCDSHWSSEQRAKSANSSRPGGLAGKWPGARVAARLRIATDMLTRSVLAAGHFAANNHKAISMTAH